MLPPVGAAAAIFLGFSALFECEGGGLAVFGGRLLIGGAPRYHPHANHRRWLFSAGGY